MTVTKQKLIKKQTKEKTVTKSCNVDLVYKHTEPSMKVETVLQMSKKHHGFSNRYQFLNLRRDAKLNAYNFRGDKVLLPPGGG